MTQRAPFAVIVLSLLLSPALPAQTVSDSNLAITPAAGGLELPTGFRFLGGGSNDLFAIEKNSGKVQRVLDGFVSTVLDLNVANNSERGLLGIELHPNFTSNGQVYLYYSTATEDGGTWQDNRLARFIWNETDLVADPSFTPVIFGSAADGITGNGPNHDAGPIRFGPDGKLYGTTGDLNRNRAEQNNSSLPNSSALVGGIYRLNDDGTIPTDNPFAANANANFRRWYAYGVRNTFGIAFDPDTNALWDTENGPDVYDEINRVNPGFNSGWNEIMGPDALSGGSQSNLVQLPGSVYSDPEFSYFDPVAVTGVEFLSGSALGAGYDDAVIVGANNTGALYLFRLNDARTGFELSGNLADLVASTDAERDSLEWAGGFAGVTELLIGPDGALYVTDIGGGTIYRIAPIPEPSIAGVFALLIPLLLRRRN